MERSPLNLKNPHFIFVILTLCLFSFNTYAASVGAVKYARGAVTIQKGDGSGARLVGKGDAFIQGDVIKTGSKSFAIIRLEDNTRMTLRPGTSFAVEEFVPMKENTASAVLRLFRGGMRAVTGFISKFNPKGYKVRTSVATLGIRGTEFDARLCQGDCSDESEKIAKKRSKQAAKVVAKSVFIRGILKARAYAGNERDMKPGSSIYEGDTLLTGPGSYAILAFVDKSRMSLQADTRLRIDELRFEEEKPKSRVSALFNLFRGGFRAVTGLIGQRQPRAYRVRTAVATLGIRGTGYDMLCTGACISDGTDDIQTESGTGFYAYVWRNKVTIDQLLLEEGLAAYKKDKEDEAEVLTTVPGFFLDNPVPKPSDVEIDESQLFVLEQVSEPVEPGFYVSVKEGRIDVKSEITGKTISLVQGQASVTDFSGRKNIRLPGIPSFMSKDVYPSPGEFSEKTLNILGTSFGESLDKELVCEIQ